MCLLKRRKQSFVRKIVRKIEPKNKRKKVHENYLIEDPSIKHEAHSRWEAEVIYDEDDFDDWK